MYTRKPLGPMLGRAGHLCRERMDFRLSQYDVTPAQTHLLLFLHDHGGQAPQCEVTEHLQVRPSTVNGILDRLEEKGMITRTVSGHDARRRLVALTEKGREQRELFQGTFQAVEELILREFSPEEAAAFYGMLDRIIQNLEEDRINDEKAVAPCAPLRGMDRRRCDMQRSGGGF